MKNKLSKILSVVYILSIVSCVLLTAYLTSDALGRYFTKADGEDGARGARFAFDVKDNSDKFELDISDVNYPGMKKEYTFTVTNNNGAISEVSEQVSAEITLSGELPLKVTLTDGTTKFIEITSKETKKAEIVSFEAGVTGNKILTLIVEWPPEENSAAYSEKSSQVTISLTAEQIN